jgi:hypothetical protein
MRRAAGGRPGACGVGGRGWLVAASAQMHRRSAWCAVVEGHHGTGGRFPRGLAVWADLAACPHGWPLWCLAALGASFERVGSMRPVGGRRSTP